MKIMNELVEVGYGDFPNEMRPTTGLVGNINRKHIPISKSSKTDKSSSSKLYLSHFRESVPQEGKWDAETQILKVSNETLSQNIQEFLVMILTGNLQSLSVFNDDLRYLNNYTYYLPSSRNLSRMEKALRDREEELGLAKQSNSAQMVNIRQNSLNLLLAEKTLMDSLSEFIDKYKGKEMRLVLWDYLEEDKYLTDFIMYWSRFSMDLGVEFKLDIVGERGNYFKGLDKIKKKNPNNYPETLFEVRYIEEGDLVDLDSLSILYFDHEKVAKSDDYCELLIHLINNGVNLHSETIIYKKFLHSKKNKVSEFTLREAEEALASNPASYKKLADSLYK